MNCVDGVKDWVTLKPIVHGPRLRMTVLRGLCPKPRKLQRNPKGNPKRGILSNTLGWNRRVDRRNLVQRQKRSFPRMTLPPAPLTTII